MFWFSEQGVINSCTPGCSFLLFHPTNTYLLLLKFTLLSDICALFSMRYTGPLTSVTTRFWFLLLQRFLFPLSSGGVLVIFWLPHPWLLDFP